MASNAQIAEAMNNVIDIFKKSPERGLSTDRTACVLEDGLKCTVSQGEHSAIIDMGEMMGGDGAGPNPGFFGRAALISCIAIGVKMAAARADIQLDKIGVDVEMDWDNRGIFDLDGISASPIAIRVSIAIDSEADKAAIEAIIPGALKGDSWLQTFVNPNTIEPVVTINQMVNVE